jgi:predicted nucleic acid-binding Zn ribbon protein
MNCPRCGKENPEDGRFCNACGCALTDNRPDVRVSRMAIVSFVCALLALALVASGLIAVTYGRVLGPISKTFFLFGVLLSLPTLAGAIILGFISINRT